MNDDSIQELASRLRDAASGAYDIAAINRLAESICAGECRQAEDTIPLADILLKTACSQPIVSGSPVLDALLSLVWTPGVDHKLVVNFLLERLRHGDGPTRLAVVLVLEAWDNGMPDVDHIMDAFAALRYQLGYEDLDIDCFMDCMSPLHACDQDHVRGELCHALRDTEPSVRRFAAHWLMRYADRSLVQPITEAIGDPDDEVRVSALRAFERVGDMDGCRFVYPLLSDPNPSVRAAAIEALGKHGGAAALPHLVAALGDPEATPSVRAAAVEALGKHGGAAALPHLVAALGDPDAAVQAAAARVLGEMRNPCGVEPLLRLVRSSDERTQRAAVESLGHIGDTSATAPLVELLDDLRAARPSAPPQDGRYGWFAPGGACDDPIVRSGVVEALGRIGDTRAVEPLIPLLSDHNDEVRRLTANALGVIGDERARCPLVPLLHDPSGAVRSIAVQALERLGPDGLVNELADVLDDDVDERVKAHAATVLGDLNSPRAIASLARAMGRCHYGSFREVAAAAVAALGRIGGSQVVEPLISSGRFEMAMLAAKALRSLSADALLPTLLLRLRDTESACPHYVLEMLAELKQFDAAVAALQHPDAEIQCRAAATLGLMKDPRAVDALVSMVHRQDADVRVAVVKALNEIGDARAFDVLVEALGDEDPEVREAAIGTLGCLGDKRAIPALTDLLKKGPMTGARERPACVTINGNLWLRGNLGRQWQVHVKSAIRAALSRLGCESPVSEDCEHGFLDVPANTPF